jgi:spoIIIJ-associated protein
MSKQDVSAVVEQDSSPVVENPVAGSAAVESAEGTAAEIGSAEGESAEVGAAEVATPKPAASAKDTTKGAASDTSAEDMKAEDVRAKPTRKPKKASAKNTTLGSAMPATATDATATDATATDATATDATATDATATDATATDATATDVAAGGVAAGGVAAEDAKTGDAHARPTRKPTKASALVREGEVAADFLEQLLDIADLDGDIDVDVDGDRAAVAIVDSEEGRVSRRLVGPDGKVLEALQELTRLAVQSATGERSRLMLDVAGHRAERRAALVTIAQGVIATVKASGEKQPMQPMTAFERKVVHDAVLASGLGSESEGAEPHRFVVILPA